VNDTAIRASSQTFRATDTKTAVHVCPTENTAVNLRSAESVQVQAPNAKSQRAAVLRLLVDAKGGWVALPDVLALGIAQYNARILELRRLGFVIENKTERVAGARHSWFRLLNSPAQP
jgi:hypothetical protein